jgi:hypothetical protein
MIKESGEDIHINQNPHGCQHMTLAVRALPSRTPMYGQQGGIYLNKK